MEARLLLVHWVQLARGIALGIVLGIAVGLALGIARGIALGVAVGLALGATGGLFEGIVLGIAAGIVPGVAFGFVLGLVGGIARWIAGGIALGREIARGITVGVAGGIAFGFVLGIVFGIVFGIGLGMAGELAHGIAEGIVGGIAVGIAGGISLGITRGITRGIAKWIAALFALGLAGGIVLGIVFLTTEELAGGIAEGIAGGIAVVITFGIALGIAFLRAYYYPWHLALCFFAPAVADYRLHPAAWDDMCSLPFAGLDRLLLAYRDADVEAGDQEIERLVASYPSQRMQALRARVAAIAREAGRIAELGRLDEIVNRLPEGDKAFLMQTPRVREMVAEIAQAQRRLDAVDRPFLRQPYAESVVARIEAFRGQISGFREPLASEFRDAAAAWLARAKNQLEQVQDITNREPTPQVFRAGDPVDRSQEAFVARMGVIGQVERQITLATGCPGLFVYGRRRMGKSTLLRNLDAFVPETVRIATISMQNPAAFTSIGHFAHLIDQELRAALEDDTTLTNDDLPGLFQRLTSANAELEKAGRRLVLAFDEFENIDQKIGEGVFTEDLLATIRESIQSHRRLIWAFAGSHPITALTHAPWPSYLVSIQTIEIPPFTPEETRLLLTDPLKQSPLYARDAERRPHFEPGFWGDGGIEWTQEQTAGWPHLVQLLAGTAVDLANESVADRLDHGMLEEATRRAIVSGDTVLRQLLHGETRSEAEAAYLAGFRTADTQPPPTDEATIQSLRARQIVAEENGVWHLKVPLMQAWLRTRG